MATVRFSDRLKEEIIINARKMFKAELRTAIEDVPKTWNGLYFYNTLFPKDVVDKMEALPEKFLPETRQLMFAGFKSSEDTNEGRGYWSLGDDIQFDLVTPVRMPDGSHFDDWDKSWRSITLAHDAPRFATIQAEFKVWRDKAQAIKNKRETFERGVKRVMNTYSTLSPALKAWPALWDLVPDEAKERHMRVTDRKKGEVKELGDLDVNNLTATVTLNKLTR